MEGYRDTDGNGSNDTWVVEHKDAFTIDANGHASDDPAHDAAGNMTYDGTCRYTYDAWNRLVKVEKAYRDPSGGSVTAGSVQAEMRYDGMGRRIVKQVRNGGDHDCTYSFYHKGQQIVETRNGSDQVIKQYVWGLDYIDELVQTSLNGDPVDDPGFDPADQDHDPTCLYALHDANYNVLGVVDDAGILVERYEYEPFGKRTVYFSPGDNDTGLHAPTLISRRFAASGTQQPWGHNEFGHQGLMHDEGVANGDLIYNRARMLHVRIGRFAQRDPAGYSDARSLYTYKRGDPLSKADPSGRVLIAFDGTNNAPADETNVSSFFQYYTGGVPAVKGKYLWGIGTKVANDTGYEGTLGSATGIGIDSRIREAEHFLDCYLKKYGTQDNNVNIIGFSRGAFTARLFSNLIYQMLRKYNAQIRFIGVWDTVPAFGFNAAVSPKGMSLSVPQGNPPVFHAMSIHENRSTRFRLNRFNSPGAKEVWLTCSPNPDPSGMRVPTGRKAKETLDDGTTCTQTAQPRADHRQAA